MKFLKTLKCLSAFTGFLMAAAGVKGQNVHFAQVQDMNPWYNPALKINKVPLVHAGIRSVKYRGITAYTSKAAMIELPFGGAKEDGDNTGFMNLAVGMNADNATNGIVKASTAMMAFSYALPLNYDNTYLSAGIQATYSFSQVGFNGEYLFPDQFDQYGPIGAAVSADPFQSGYQYGYFTAGVGFAVFHYGSEKQWHIGGSVRHLNQPYTEWTHSTRLPMNRGIQAGYTAAINEEDAIGGYGNFSWQVGAYEHVIGALYNHSLGDSANTALFLGTGYRIGDALMPNVGFKTGSSRFAFSYEFNTAGIASGNYSRRAFEFSYTLNL